MLSPFVAVFLFVGAGVVFGAGALIAAKLLRPIAALAEGLGDREAAVAREISKKFEETVTGSLSSLAARYADAPPRGEIVVVVAPPGAPAPAKTQRGAAETPPLLAHATCL